MWMDSIDRDELISVVGPAMGHGGADEIARRVSDRWTPRQLCQMLHDRDPDVRKIGCVILGLVGDRRTVSCLTAALRDGEPAVNQLAEHAMWSIWFRAGTPRAQRLFQRGIQTLERGETELAVELLKRSRRVDPAFAEAYNQCSIACYMLEDYEASIDEALVCVELEPMHFGALAGLGHCYAHLGDLSMAAMYYRKAVAVNPRLEAVASALGRINAATHVA